MELVRGLVINTVICTMLLNLVFVVNANSGSDFEELWTAETFEDCISFTVVPSENEPAVKFVYPEPSSIYFFGYKIKKNVSLPYKRSILIFSPLQFTVKTSDAFGVVDKVYFFANGKSLKLVEKNPEYPHTYKVWFNQPGFHCISAVAVDKNNSIISVDYCNILILSLGLLHQ